MYCKHCGKQIPDDAKFCTECGGAVDGAIVSHNVRQPNSQNPEIPQKVKKPLFKRVWFWIIAVPVILFVLIILYAIVITILNAGEEQAKQATAEIEARTQYAEDVADALMNGTEIPPSPSLESPPTQKNSTIDCTINGCHVTYLSHEIVLNMAGDTCIAVYYQFENNSNEPKIFDLTINDKAYQDGIQLSFSMFHVNNLSKDAGMEIQPGVSVVVCSGFELRNEMSDVELTVAPLFNIDSNPTASMILSISGL